MKVYLKTATASYSAVGEYDLNTKELVVLPGSIVSENISHTMTFTADVRIEAQRKEFVEGREVKKPAKFKSPSTAANFVTGRSTNGLISWKDENGKTLKSILSEK